jgi:preprotein translocase subunit SecG
MSSSGSAERTLNYITVTVSLVWFLSIVGLGLITKFQVLGA